MKYIIVNKETLNRSEPVNLEWFIFGNSDLQFEDGSTLPLNDFKYFYDDYEIKEML